MKKFFLCMFSVLVVFTACAQTKDFGFFLEMNGGYGEVKHQKVFGYKHDGFLFLTPALGYQFNNNWAAGLRVSFEMAGDKYSTCEIYGQYGFLRLKRLKIFGEALVSFSVKDVDGGDDNYIEAGFSLGVSYALGRHWSLLLRYPYIGYSDGYHRHDGFCLGDGKFLIDGNLRRLQMGVQIIF